MTRLVFDTTALSHFARAGRMDELRMAVADDEPVLLAEVAAELARGIPGYPSLLFAYAVMGMLVPAVDAVAASGRC